MKTKTITVTRNDIKNGIQRLPLQCPVSRAMSRALGETVLVTTQGFYTLPEFCELHEFCDKRVTRWICDFDAERPVKPFTFEISEKATRSLT